MSAPSAPVLAATYARDGAGRWLWALTIGCPYCGHQHHHGGGIDPRRPDLGHRGAHCRPGAGYVLTDGTTRRRAREAS